MVVMFLTHRARRKSRRDVREVSEARFFGRRHICGDQRDPHANGDSPVHVDSR